MTEEMKLETIAKGYYCGLEGSRNNWIINTEQAWSAFYVKLESRSSPRPPTPFVDFSKYTVVAAFMGEFPTDGYSTEIHKVLQQGKKMEVQIQESSPGEDDCCLQAFTQPYHVVKVEKVEGKVEFTYAQ